MGAHLQKKYNTGKKLPCVDIFLNIGNKCHALVSRVNTKMFHFKIIQVTRKLLKGNLSNFQAAAASVSGFHPLPVILAISFSISGVIFSRMKEVMLFGV